MNNVDLKVQALEAFIDRKERLKKSTPLQYLFWESTLRCNLSCLHCGSDCVRNDAATSQEISADLIKQELGSIAQHYVPQNCTFAIIGGEPLVREEIIDIGAFAAGLGYNWGITTNGMLLSRNVIKRLKEAHLKTISVSLDGIEADHEKLRHCKGSYQIVTSAIRNFLQDRFFEKFDVICCISKINIDHLEIFMEEVVKLGIPAV